MQSGRLREYDLMPVEERCMTETLTLGTAEELPADYRARLTELSVLPAWTLLRAGMPVGKPVNQARATHWCSWRSVAGASR
jgi:hypothetical protein